MRKRVDDSTFAFEDVLLGTAVGVLVLVLLASACGKRPQQVQADTSWSDPETLPLSDQVRLTAIDGEPVCIDGNDYYFLGGNGTRLDKRTFLPTVRIANAHPRYDPASTRFILHDGDAGFGNIRDGQFHARIACCSLELRARIRTIFDLRITLDTDELLGTNRTSTSEISLPETWRQSGPPQIRPREGRLGGSLILSNSIYVAYSISCDSVYGPNMVVGGTGPNQAGLIYSNGDGSPWTRLKLLDIDTSWHAVFATSEHLYFLAGVGRGLERNLAPGLRSVRVSRALDTQTEPEIVAPTFSGRGGNYAAVTEADTIHLAWLDHRHERSHNLRAMLTGTSPGEGNWELYYRQRKDSDSGWTKEVFLSKGIDFVFSPRMAVEGDNVVVVWSGFMRDEEHANPWLKSDIYFTTSSDGGATWKPPARITDNAKTGMTAVYPQVALYRGVIHLFYTGGGFTHQYRPFPLD